MHALIVGPRGIGKSTLIGKVIDELSLSCLGFQTKKEDSLADPEKGSPVYIYDAGGPRVQTPENLLGYCRQMRAKADKAPFDAYAVKLHALADQTALRKNGSAPHQVILLDEIGFMEACSEDFSRGILRLLDGDTPVLAAVKDKEFPFLDQVRSHPKATCFYITTENRDALAGEVTDYLRQMLK